MGLTDREPCLKSQLIQLRENGGSRRYFVQFSSEEAASCTTLCSQMYITGVGGTSTQVDGCYSGQTAFVFRLQQSREVEDFHCARLKLDNIRCGDSHVVRRELWHLRGQTCASNILQTHSSLLI